MKFSLKRGRGSLSLWEAENKTIYFSISSWQNSDCIIWPGALLHDTTFNLPSIILLPVDLLSIGLGFRPLSDSAWELWNTSSLLIGPNLCSLNESDGRGGLGVVWWGSEGMNRTQSGWLAAGLVSRGRFQKLNLSSSSFFSLLSKLIFYPSLFTIIKIVNFMQVFKHWVFFFF